MQPSPTASSARALLALTRRDRPAAEKAMADLSEIERVALVCEAPVAERGRLIELAPDPADLIHALPPAELCFTLKAIGLADSAWMLEHASDEQIVAAVDLDAWRGVTLDLATANEWLGALARAPEPVQVRAIEALDAELVTLALRARIAVEQKPVDAEGWSPPEGHQTLEGQFYFAARADGDDLADVVALLRALFEGAYWTYFRLMHAVTWELTSETEEWALRWRSGRLADLGFPPWDEAVRIYRHLPPERRDALPPGPRTLDVEPWALPVWLPELPETGGAGQRLFRAMAEVPEAERRALFHAFVALANRVAVADRMPLGDAESTPAAIAKAARTASAGLAHLAERHALDDATLLERVDLEHLFRLGANLDPDAARPPPVADSDADEDAGGSG